MLSVLATLTLMQSGVVAAERADTSERVVRVDRAWLAHRAPERRAEAVKAISGAVVGFFSGQFLSACRQLDRATAALEGRTIHPSDGLRLALEPPVVEPGGQSEIVVKWLYLPESDTKIDVRSEPRRLEVAPGQTVRLPVTAFKQEGSQAFVVEIAGRRRETRLHVVKDLDARLQAIEGSATAEAIRQRIEGRYEVDFPVARWLAQAERAAKGKDVGLEDSPVLRHRQTVFRASIPKSVSKEPTVVVALHGAGGSENFFFDGYGAGLAVREARRRGWILLSPRATASAAADVLDWLRKDRGLTPKRLFIMGHSMGGGLALQTESLSPKALALFAPAATGLPPALSSTPIFLAVGREEMGMLRAGADRLAEAIQGRNGSVYRQYENCEHLMIVAEALPDAFRFFERVRP